MQYSRPKLHIVSYIFLTALNVVYLHSATSRLVRVDFRQENTKMANLDEESLFSLELIVDELTLQETTTCRFPSLAFRLLPLTSPR